ncbi:hypothetical protein EMIHUDRAFT_209731 [Emiliania huxleyi CCMP1516]|uniref:Uncharacterized protein n=2 Tax=Emiliania huxleyi TaxID=2903 RepID=A0A0D3J2N2_EMIH1|nr:hypothetical protein EMIHUDRAFT_209731 [Emiliania huxleyi CCMP1516]EOD17767.1 hypothetical protein EMIHUDRAFT_209731 [Emiliania huxleyi CCMP1516]|eukprot:XP_005770196.1 hypothetical protein EMIHUDRAFT_209731 [Emiliania huxleyi CCMP1516]
MQAKSRSAWGEASARAMLSKDCGCGCANSRASHETLGGVMPAMAPMRVDFCVVVVS